MSLQQELLSIKEEIRQTEIKLRTLKLVYWFFIVLIIFMIAIVIILFMIHRKNQKSYFKEYDYEKENLYYPNTLQPDMGK